MADIDAQTSEWLHSLKLGDKLEYISDFQNGYYMGVVFERLNLARGKKFKDTHDMACKFQNYKNIRDLLLQNFKVEFPIQNILYNTQQLLHTIRDCCKKYNKDKKQATLRRIQTFSESKIQPHQQKAFNNRQKEILSTSKLNQTSKFPRKIQQIQQKLQKYREIKTKHELLALDDRKKEIEQNRKLIEEHRLYQLNKVRTNHQFMRQHQRKVYDIWTKTEQIKKTRIEKDNNLNKFLDDKKNKFYQSLRQEEVKSLKEGQEAFQLNCIRQGIQLEHDPDKPLRKTEQGFNKQVVMERIKDNIKTHEKERKERIKRQNKKTVDAKEANLKSQALWSENNLVESYANKIKKQLTFCTSLKKQINCQEAQKKAAIQKRKNRTFSELPQPKIDTQLLKEEYRKRKIQYLDEQVVRLERRHKKHKIIAENALEALISIVISKQDQYYSNNGFTYSEWKEVQKEFLQFEKKQNKTKDKSKYIDNSYENKAKQYINCQGIWETQQKVQHSEKLAEMVQSLVEKAYPMAIAPANKTVPLYMPLKIGFVGHSLSGKTTISQKLSQKYGLINVNPVTIINQAFQLNKEPVIEDPKKKKEAKKPEEENPQKIALKDWGQKLMKRLTNPANATIQHFLQAIEFKLNYNFQNKKQQQILAQFQQSKLQQSQRLAKALKEYEQIQKKGKKDTKKVGQQSDEVPTEKKYFYTKGFIIDGIDLDIETLKSIEQRLNAFISFQQRINKKGESIKENISNIIPIPKAQKDTRLSPGTFDLLIELNSKQQTLELRQNAEKKDIRKANTELIQQFYSNFGNEKAKSKAYRKIQNQGTVQQCITKITQHIEQHLSHKYTAIASYQQIGKVQVQEQSTNVEKSPLKLLISQVEKNNCEKLILRFQSIYRRYLNQIVSSFSDIDNLRVDYGKSIITTQQNFVNIINRPDDKAGKILNFQQNYNKLLSEKTNIVKDVEASKHLISKLDELYDSLWTSLEGKKNQAVVERQKTLSSNLLNSEIQKVIEVAKSLIQNQLTLLIEIIFFLYNINNVAKTGNKDEIPTQFLVLGVPPSIEPIYSFQTNSFVSDRLDYYTNQALQCLNTLPNWLKKKQKKFSIVKLPFIQQLMIQFIDLRKIKIISLIQQIRDKMKGIYLQYYCYFKVLTNKMDDWIIQGIKYENQFVYQIYKNIKKNIQEAKKSGIKDLFVKDITEIIHPLQSLPPHRLPIVSSTTKNSFKILSYTIFMQQLKCLATNGRIPFKIFQSYIEKRKKSNLLQNEFLKLELDIMQQFLVTDDYCNYKEVALAMLLWKIKILQEDEINEYQNMLIGRTGNESSENYQHLRQNLNLEEFILIPNITTNKQQQRILKIFIFQIFRQEFRQTLTIKDYIDTLRLFCQLQAYKYGDTIMMLHQTSNHIEQKS